MEDLKKTLKLMKNINNAFPRIRTQIAEKKFEKVSKFKIILNFDKSRLAIHAAWAALYFCPGKRKILENLITWFRFGHGGKLNFGIHITGS